ncbi:hypothetical protein [Singulisphaera acidiphila]|uniref:Uncharacterized protein n=1 Tax=Singulisphaera acidiphila (strain ATCC BAA-1392 / DSM 18658 / VKM B-2454 / MOB10) TaxID=886293 RepID=L0DPC1_SINAD|nr:hypothetical protein [Singulisphaera acidiphila]AGA30521.1 hypothetical protein Sinac_6442 [Singulisphaera acidiphila DSM 18658]
MTAVFCHNPADHKAKIWANQLKSFERLEFVISGAAKAIAAAVEKVAQTRRNAPSAPALEHGLDVFHTTVEVERVLDRHWRRAKAAWEKAKTAKRAVAHLRRQGIDARGVAQTARTVWRPALASFEQVECLETAWKRVHTALDQFPGGLAQRTPAPRPRWPRRLGS